MTPDGRIVLSLHQFYEPAHRVVELMPDGTLVPFPTPTWAGSRGEDGVGMTAVLGLRSDRDGVVWMLDNAAGSDAPPRLIGWDTRAEGVAKVIDIPSEVSVEASFHNDLALDQERPVAYLADIAGAIVVLNLDTGEARRVLDGHPSTTAEDVDFVVRGEVLTDPQGEPVRTALNPITIAPDNAHVYYGAMNGTAVWRVPTTALADPALSADALAAAVERYGDKPPSDGITIDAAGNDTIAREHSCVRQHERTGWLTLYTASTPRRAASAPGAGRSRSAGPEGERVRSASSPTRPDWDTAAWHPESAALHGIGRRALLDAPSAAEVARRSVATVGERLLVADAPAWGPGLARPSARDRDGPGAPVGARS